MVRQRVKGGRELEEKDRWMKKRDEEKDRKKK